MDISLSTNKSFHGVHGSLKHVRGIKNRMRLGSNSARYVPKEERLAKKQARNAILNGINDTTQRPNTWRKHPRKKFDRAYYNENYHISGIKRKETKTHARFGPLRKSKGGVAWTIHM